MLWLRDAHLPLEQRAPLVVAHDWHDAERRTPLTLTEALDAFLEPPLDRVEIDLDIKLPGREEEIVDGAARARPARAGDGLDDGALHAGRILELEPELRRGWTYPKVTKDWTSKRWAKAPMLAALVGDAPPPARPRRARSCRSSGSRRCGSTTRWSAARLARITQARRGRADRLDGRRPAAHAQARRRRASTGICSNDPRLFERLET